MQLYNTGSCGVGPMTIAALMANTYRAAWKGTSIVHHYLPLQHVYCSYHSASCDGTFHTLQGEGYHQGKSLLPSSALAVVMWVVYGVM